MSEGFVKLMRSDATWELMKDPNAFCLLSVIAFRAKRTDDFNVHGLRKGQALIGDYASYGMTEKEYRGAKQRLQRYGLAHFRGTNRGTIATLLNTSVCDINEEGYEHSEGRQRAHTQRPEGRTRGDYQE